MTKFEIKTPSGVQQLTIVPGSVRLNGEPLRDSSPPDFRVRDFNLNATGTLDLAPGSAAVLEGWVRDHQQRIEAARKAWIADVVAKMRSRGLDVVSFDTVHPVDKGHPFTILYTRGGPVARFDVRIDAAGYVIGVEMMGEQPDNPAAIQAALDGKPPASSSTPV